MGQEYDETAPFQFFADFQDPALKKAVSEGRRGEFKDFDFADVPDPEDPATFERSKLTWADGAQNREMLDWYQQLLQLRKQNVVNGERTARRTVCGWLADDAGAGAKSHSCIDRKSEERCCPPDPRKRLA